jgi:ATP-binding cassette subfamily C protein
VIKALRREPHFDRQFADSAERNADARRRNNFVATLPRLTLETLAVGAILAGVAAVALRDGTATDLLPVLGLFAAAAIRLMPAVARIAAQASNLRFNTAAIEAIETDLGAIRAAAPSAPAAAPVPLTREIALDRVCYRYPGTAGDTLHDISFVIKRGESVGLVGPSGAGKTTLADVLLGLLVPTAGRMAVDGVAINGPMRVAYVPQDVFLLDDTLRRNVALGVLDREIDAARMRAAINGAQLDGVVAQLPGGLDAGVGERGVKLSGGQRQRVGIARALYQDADLLVLDEATSSLDAETESEVAGAITRLHGERTMVIIAHRLTTVKNCDRLLFMADGRIVDSGSFPELLARNTAFRRMVQQMELSAEEPHAARLHA